MRGPSASDAGVSLASTITTDINQRAEARLVALGIKGTFDSVWWKGLLAHLWSVDFEVKLFNCLNHINFIQSLYQNCYTIGFLALTFCYCWSSSGSNMVLSPI